MAKYCNICGTKMGNKEKFCPKCGAPYTAPPQMANTNKPIQKKNNDNKKTIIIAIIAGVIILFTFVVGILLISGAIGQDGNSKKGENDNLDELDTSIQTITNANGGNISVDPPETGAFEATTINVEEYYQSSSTIISKIPVQNSNSIHSGAEAYSNLESRGFYEYPIYVSYSINGEYIGDTEISSSSTDKYPTYFTYYTASNGDIWTIFENNGVVMARPVSYILNNNYSQEILFSEATTVIAYDSSNNQFYELSPYDTIITLKVVDRIDAETLDDISYWGIE